MFTGLVEKTGRITDKIARGSGARVTIEAAVTNLRIGASIAVNGVCLTVAACTERSFSADLSVETLERTTFGRLATGAGVNLERALSAGDALGGHFVSGHIDGIAVIERVSEAGADRRVALRPPQRLIRFLAEKGSVALDGVSLTVNAVQRAGFEIMLIPHTLVVTTLKAWAPGSEVNLEVDLLARYAVHWLESARLAGAAGEGPDG